MNPAASPTQTSLLPGKAWQNWAGKQRCMPANLAEPDSAEAVVQLIQHALAEKQQIRVVGSGHSFSGLVPTDHWLVNLDRLQGLIETDTQAHTATAWGGTKLRAFGEMLHEQGMAQENLGDIDVQALAGALSTGTHGTGIGFGTLSDQIEGMEIVDGMGRTHWLDRQENAVDFSLARIALGSLGIITKLRLRTVPSYRLHFRTGKASLDEALAQFPDHNQANRNYEFYWFPYADSVQHKFSNSTDLPAEEPGLGTWFSDVFLENHVFGMMCRFAKTFPASCPALAKLSAAAVSTSERVHWSHRVYATPRLVRFQEMEYNVPRKAFTDVIQAMRACIAKERFPVHFPIECRFVAADDIGLSPAYGRESAYIAVHQYHAMPWREYFDAMQEIFLSFEGRPHWGKWHSLTAKELAPRYPQWDAFLALREQMDPTGLFLNEHLRHVFGLAAESNPS